MLLFLSAAPFPGEPGQAGLGGPGRLVLQAYPAAVTAAGQGGQVPVEVELAAAGLAAAGGVGDLDVRDEVGVRVDRGVDVVAVAGQVIQVAQEADVGGARRPGPADHGYRVGGRAQRIGLRPADRLDQDRAAERGHRLRGRPDALRRQFVLGVRAHAVDPVPVQRVEPAHAEPFADAGHYVDVVAELGDAPGDGQRPAVGTG